MIIKGGEVFWDNTAFVTKNVYIKDGKITEVQEISGEEKEIDATDMYIIPGLVDIHLHGCVGHDFCDGTEEAFDAMAKYEASVGVTTISPATMTLSREELASIFQAAGEYQKKEKREGRSTIRGITMEGPFVSMAKKGAQNGDYIHKPDQTFYREMQDLCGGMIRQVAVAPEEDEGLSFTKEISRESVVSVAHTAAGYDTACEAFAAGANHVTHLFNGMNPFHHREPGVIGAAMDHKDVFVEMICDGVHIHPSAVRAMFANMGADRICMISDSMMATGMPDGDYSLGGQAVKKKGRTPLLVDGTIAGSASNLMDCLRVVVKEMKIPLEDAVRASTLTPAKSLGFDTVCGSISVGKAADLVLLDKELNVKMVIKDGEVLS